MHNITPVEHKTRLIRQAILITFALQAFNTVTMHHRLCHMHVKKKKLIMLRSSAVVIYERNPADIFVLLFHEKTCVKEATNKQTKKRKNPTNPCKQNVYCQKLNGADH